MHAGAGAFGVALGQGSNQFGVFLDAAFGRVDLREPRQDQRAARDDFIDVIGQDLGAGQLCQQDVEFAGQPDRAGVILAEVFLFFLQMCLQRLDDRLGVHLAQPLDHLAFQALAHFEDVIGFFDGRLGDGSAAIRLQVDQAFGVESHQCIAYGRAADAKSLADRIFGKLHAGLQGLLDDGLAQGVVNWKAAGR